MTTAVTTHERSRQPAVTIRLTRIAGLVRHNLKLWLADVQVPIVLVGMPLAMMAFLRPVYRDTLATAGVADATGAEQAVPGMAVMFALLGAGIHAADLHRERMWATWDRLRASGARTGEIVVGKLLPPLLLVAGQVTVLFAAGVVLFGLEIRGTVAGLVSVAAAFAVAMLALGLLLSATIRSITRLGAIGNALAVALAGLGGAIVPLNTMPSWTTTLSPVTPGYWAMRGFQAAILDPGRVADVVVATLALSVFAALFAVIAAWRFRYGDA